MRGSELKYLANTAELARLDLETAPLTLATIKGGLVAKYQGAYSSGQRLVRIQDAPPTDVAVSAARLRDLASLFDDSDNVTVGREGNTIRFGTPSAALSLATAGPPLGLSPFVPRGEGVSLTIDAKTLYSEVMLAAEFTAKSQARPILTGIRLARVEAGLLIQASDGQMAVFEEVIPCGEGGYGFDVVSPAYDLVLGLKVVGGDEVKLFKPPTARLYVFSTDGCFDCALMAEASKWPVDGFDRAHRPVERTPLIMPAQILKNVLNSSKVLQAGNYIYLEGDGRRILLRTERSEIGEFATALDGGIVGRWRLDVDLMALAVKLGDPPTFMMADASTAVLVSNGTRAFYMFPR